MDLKQAIEEIETNKTFRVILATLLSIGNFLNGAEVSTMLGNCCVVRDNYFLFHECFS